jgi:hypothetical protein
MFSNRHLIHNNIPAPTENAKGAASIADTAPFTACTLQWLLRAGFFGWIRLPRASPTLLD